MSPAGKVASTRLGQPTDNDPTTTFRIRQTVLNVYGSGLGSAYQTARFDYLRGRSLRQVVIPPTTPFATELTKLYSYDEQGRVSSFLVNYAQPKSDGNTGERHTFTYEDNSFEYAFMRIGADGQGLPNQVNTARDIYRINPEGQLTEWVQEGIIRYGRPTRGRYVYTYENGHIVRAAYINGDKRTEFTMSYQYDDKSNPFYGWMYTIEPTLRYSRNNVVSAQYTTNKPYRTEYTYTPKGLPLIKKDISTRALLTYEYEAY